MMALHWIHKIPRDLKTFVANSVYSIQAHTEVKRCSHVGIRDNPVDVLSTVPRPKELIGNH